jgi:acyl carrier protein
MAETFNCKLNEINKKTTINKLQKWDSINHFTLISNIEKFFKIKFEPGEPETMTSFKIIIATISSHIE